MGFVTSDLDLVLVPAGLLIMFGYHLYLLLRYIRCPESTFLGYENNHKRAWVQSVMKDEKQNAGTALSATTSNTTSAIVLAQISLTLCSVIGAWIANSSSNVFESNIIFGDTGSTTLSIRYTCLLACFLLAFACFVQSARHFVNANYLISYPGDDAPVSNAIRAVIRGGELWSLGLKALYSALNLLLWFYGPIPMFIGSVILVVILYYQDTNSLELHDYGLSGSNLKRTLRQSV